MRGANQRLRLLLGRQRVGSAQYTEWGVRKRHHRWFVCLRLRIPAIVALVTYSAVVLSFLGGIEWGLALREEAGNERTRAVALGLSTVPSLAAWAVLWLQSPTQQLGTALGIFVFAWAADQYLTSRGLLPAWFVDLRTAITGVVAIILGVALWRLWSV